MRTLRTAAIILFVALVTAGVFHGFFWLLWHFARNRF
jgi:hypothetical protein